MTNVKECKKCGKEYAPSHEANATEEPIECDACGAEILEHPSHSEFTVEDDKGEEQEHAIEKGLRKAVGKPKNS